MIKLMKQLAGSDDTGEEGAILMKIGVRRFAIYKGLKLK